MALLLNPTLFRQLTARGQFPAWEPRRVAAGKLLFRGGIAPEAVGPPNASVKAGEKTNDTF